MDNKDIEGLKKHTIRQIENVKLKDLQAEHLKNMSVSEIKEVLLLLEEDVLKIEKKLIMSTKDYSNLGKIKEKIKEFQKKLL